MIQKKITAFGETKTVAEWLRDHRCIVKDRNTLYQRLWRGNMTPEECLSAKISVFKPEEYTGKTYGKMVINQAFKEGSRYFAQCKCLACGNDFTARLDSVISPEREACGCQRSPINSDNKNWRGHGEISHTQYTRVRQGALSRDCANRKMPFEISIEYMWDLFLKQNRKCALSGVELSFSSKAKLKDGTASLDRIDSSRGYIEDNVQWVHKLVNIMKQAMTDDDFISWCQKIVIHNQIKSIV